MSKAFCLATAFVVAAGAANAQSLKPIQATMIDLGSTHGSAYYITASDGFHVVATLDSGVSTIRFGATLSKGQSATISVPTALGDEPIEVTFVHLNDGLQVRRSMIPTDAVTATTR